MRPGATPKWIQDAASGRWVATQRFETNFTDLAGDGRLLGQVAGRTGRAVAGWLDDRGQDWKNQVAYDATGAVRGLPVGRHPGATARGPRRRSLPPGPAGEPGRDPGPAAGHPAEPGPPRHQQGSRVGEPAPAAARPRAPVRPGLRADRSEERRVGKECR